MMTRTVQHNEMAAFLLKPVVLTIYVFGFWCLAAQMGWAAEFVIQDGPFGNWMVWMAVAGGLHFGMKRLANFDSQRVAAAFSRLRELLIPSFRTAQPVVVETFVSGPVPSPSSEVMS